VFDDDAPKLQLHPPPAGAALDPQSHGPKESPSDEHAFVPVPPSHEQATARPGAQSLPASRAEAEPSSGAPWPPHGSEQANATSHD
jgi:hypothetical protein